jgi:hypothetical protein
VLPRSLTSGPPSWACKMCGRHHIKCLQEVQAGGCRAATVQHWPVDHSWSIATVGERLLRMHPTNPLRVLSVGERLAAPSLDCCIGPLEASSLQS